MREDGDSSLLAYRAYRAHRIGVGNVALGDAPVLEKALVDGLVFRVAVGLSAKRLHDVLLVGARARCARPRNLVERERTRPAPARTVACAHDRPCLPQRVRRPPRKRFGDELLQRPRPALRLRAVTQDVHLASASCRRRRYFQAGEHGERGPARAHSHRGELGEAVVVGYRKAGEPRRLRLLDKLFHARCPVGERRVRMEVEARPFASCILSHNRSFPVQKPAEGRDGAPRRIALTITARLPARATA